MLMAPRGALCGFCLLMRSFPPCKCPFRVENMSDSFLLSQCPTHGPMNGFEFSDTIRIMNQVSPEQNCPIELVVMKMYNMYAGPW